MALKEKLIEAKSEVEALLAYANETTGKTDVNLGEAVKTLADGYGQGGGAKTGVILASIMDGVGEVDSDVDFTGCTATQVRNYAFQNCKTLKFSSLPEGITKIGSYSFSYCEKIH